MTIEQVQDYYGKVLKSSSDLRTDACCDPTPPPAHVRAALNRVNAAVQARYFGCGMVAPERLDGLTVLDLGCGAGRDAFVLAQLVGPKGKVIGVDATGEQLAVARAHEASHAEAFGYAQPNTRFIEGPIEALDVLGVAPASIDVIVSNCVINLAADKPAVLAQAFQALKHGGELYFSDVYADRRLPEDLSQDSVLVGECLAGALYWNDFLSLAKAAGFPDPRLVADRPLAVVDAAIGAKLGAARFFSATYRLFKLAELEPACEDYGQAVIYRGDVPFCPDAFVLDKHHGFEAGKVRAVCGNTWRMLKQTRFAPHFEFIGDFSRHFGVFEGCGVSRPFETAVGGSAPSTGCC